LIAASIECLDVFFFLRSSCAFCAKSSLASGVYSFRDNGMLQNVIEERIHSRQARTIDLGNFEADALGDSIRDVE
jgi:hypothetical protein